jgi:tetratricopeptide (TPR) repeat protein
MRSLPILCAGLTLWASACSHASDPKALTDEGYTAMNEGRYETAMSSFDRALTKLDASHPLYLKARLGACQAGAFVNAKNAYEDFLALAETKEVQDGDFILMTSMLADADEIGLATDLAEVGKKRFPESPKWAALIQTLGKQAEAKGDLKAVDRLKGLGYAGGD